MDFKKQFNLSRKNTSFSVVDVLLQVTQDCDKSSASVRLHRSFRVVYNDDDLLASFIKSVESDPVKSYKHHFIYNTPIEFTISVTPVDPSNYSIDCVTTDESLFVVSRVVRLDIYDQQKYNQSILRYQLK